MIRRRHGKTPYELLHNKPPDLSYLHVFGATCHPRMKVENMGKLQPRLILLPAMASEHSSSGPALHEMTPVSLSSGLVPNPSPSTPFVPPSRSDWDLLFQPMFDESLNVDFHAPEVIAPIPEAVAPEHAVSTGSPSSTIKINHDIEVCTYGNDPVLRYSQIPEVPSDQNLQQTLYIKKIGTAVDPSSLSWYDFTLLYLTPGRPDLKQFAIDSCVPGFVHLPLTAFADADHAGCQYTRRSTSAYNNILVIDFCCPKSFGCDHNLPTMALDSIKFQCTVITKAAIIALSCKQNFWFQHIPDSKHIDILVSFHSREHVGMVGDRTLLCPNTEYQLSRTSSLQLWTRKKRISDQQAENGGVFNYRRILGNLAMKLMKSGGTYSKSFIHT
ncbi:hypothetical protein Tco_0531762 [Tanacetum coccineum]